MKYKKLNDGSYVHNCFIARRESEKSAFLFHQTDEGISAFLNGYAIIPMEEYAKLTGVEFDSNEIDKADIDLHHKDLN